MRSSRHWIRSPVVHLDDGHFGLMLISVGKALTRSAGFAMVVDPGKISGRSSHAAADAERRRNPRAHRGN